MADYSDSVELSADGQSLDDQLLEVTDTTGKTKKPINTLGKKRVPRGFLSSNVRNSAELKVLPPTISLVDWREWMRTDKQFEINGIPNKAGKKERWLGCEVEEVSRMRSDGDRQETVRIVFRERRVS